MQRIDVPSASTTLPPPAAPGTPGYFTNGNPLTAQQATIVDQDWLNMVQEEIVNVVAAGGLTLSKSNYVQLLAALHNMFGGAGLLATSGYMRLPGGLLIQWGTGSTSTGNQDVVTLPTSFASNCIAVIAMESNVAGWSSGSGPPSPRLFGWAPNGVSSFKLSCATILSGGGTTYQTGNAYTYIALGY